MRLGAFGFHSGSAFLLTFSMLLCKVTFAGLRGHKNVCVSIRSTKMPDFLGSEMSKGSPPAWRLPHYQRGVSFFFGEKELVAPEFMVKSDAVECQMCLA